MSFCIDLWNGINIIKDKYALIRREFRSFVNFLTKYNTFETQHCKNLDILYNEFKEKNNQTDSKFELARIHAINMINYESQNRKNFIENISNLIKRINTYLLNLKNPSNEIPDLTENFLKEFDKLKVKKEMFYNQCKEMSSLISQLDLDNKLNDKSNEPKLNKALTKLIKSRDEYLFSINETNIKRRNYNIKVEQILDKYEKEYKEILKYFIDNLLEFNKIKKEIMDELCNKEKYFYSEYYPTLNVDNEIYNFIINNVTKEFPMVQIEFTPFKKKDFETFLNSKYHNKLKQKDLNKVMTSINDYFKINNIFPLNFIQTGISKVIAKPQKENSLSRKFSIFAKKNNNIENNISKNKNENILDKEINIIKNFEFVKNFINEIVSDNKIKIFESKYVIDTDISKILNDTKNFDNINDKIKELNTLLLDVNEDVHLVYIESFIKTLSYLRSKGCFSINDNAYEILCDLFIKILKKNNNNDYIIKNILILAQTFYKIENGEKIYIQERIKNDDIFNSSVLWHRCINYNLKLANKDLNISGKEYKDKINKDAYSTVITYLCDLKSFTADEKVFNDVANFYMKIYNLKEEDIKMNVEISVKSRLKTKEKEIKKNEIKEEKEDKNEIIINSIDNNINKNKEDKNEIIIEKNLDDNINNKEDKNEIIINNIENNIDKTVNKNEKINENNIDNSNKENKNEMQENNQDNKIENNIDNNENKNEIIDNNINIDEFEIIDKTKLVTNNDNKNDNSSP